METPIVTATEVMDSWEEEAAVMAVGAAADVRIAPRPGTTAECIEMKMEGEGEEEVEEGEGGGG